MSIAHQVTDIVVAAVVAGFVAFVFGGLAPQLSVTVGVVLACAYYFSRNPWASEEADAINDRIDDLYEQYLPF